jgi:hypothetical protein
VTWSTPSNPVIGPDGQQLTVVIADLPASERFTPEAATRARLHARSSQDAETIDSNGFRRAAWAC